MNITRTPAASGDQHEPVSVGFWFALGAWPSAPHAP
jgi:hypothetical protein